MCEFDPKEEQLEDFRVEILYRISKATGISVLDMIWRIDFKDIRLIKIEVFYRDQKDQLKPAQTIVTQYLSEVPGTRFLLSHGLYVGNSYRNKGIANILQEIKPKIAKALEFKQLVCTVNADNVVEKHLLEKWSWKNAGRIGETEVWSKSCE